MRVLALFGGLFVCYLTLAGGMKAEDVGMGLAAAALATILATAQARTARFRFGFWLPPARTFRLAGDVAPQLVAVGRCLFAAIVAPPAQSTGASRSRHYGEYVRQPYAQDQRISDPRELTRNAWLTLLVSMLPRSFVIRRDFAQTLTLHALPPKAPSPDEYWPL